MLRVNKLLKTGWLACCDRDREGGAAWDNIGTRTSSWGPPVRRSRSPRIPVERSVTFAEPANPPAWKPSITHWLQGGCAKLGLFRIFFSRGRAGCRSSPFSPLQNAVERLVSGREPRVAPAIVVSLFAQATRKAAGLCEPGATRSNCCGDTGCNEPIFTVGTLGQSLAVSFYT